MILFLLRVEGIQSFGLFQVMVHSLAGLLEDQLLGGSCFLYLEGFVGVVYFVES